jgi:3-dehydroquinate synthase class II
MELGEHCEFIVNGFFLNFDGSQRGNLLQLTDDDVRKYVERKINMLREKIILRQDARVVLSDKLFQKIKERLDAIKSVDKTEKEEFKIKSEAYNKLEFGADGLPIDKTELSRILQYKPKEKRLEQEEVKAGEGEATQ